MLTARGFILHGSLSTRISTTAQNVIKMHVKKFIHTKTRDKLPGDLAGIFREAPRAGVSRVSGPAAGFAQGWVRRVPRGRQAGRCDDTVEVPKISVSIHHASAGRQ
jgi:hypothetical protein